MRAVRVVRIAAAHFALYCFVVLYILLGAYGFHYLEGEYENIRHGQQRRLVGELKAQLIRDVSRTRDPREIDLYVRHFMKNISTMHISLDNYLHFDGHGHAVHKRWTYPTSVLFAFTILTTIGYGNVTPTTQIGQIFTMIYGAFGIPLFLITIADLGRFIKTFIMYVVKKVYRKELKKQGEPQNMMREVAEVILVAVLFLTFIAAGSAVLALWEHDMTYFDSVYFSYMSLTTIGLGDIVPRRMDFLVPTLIYLTIGLWLTTALVEQLADVFRLVHYAGRHIGDVKGLTIWLGGHKLSVGDLIKTVCRRVGLSDNITSQINWDRTISKALQGEQPPPHPIVPWHFADFADQDPPLIDVSLDVSLDSPYYNVAPTICNSPQHNGTYRRKTSAPEIESTRYSPSYTNLQDSENGGSSPSQPSIHSKHP